MVVEQDLQMDQAGQLAVQRHQHFFLEQTVELAEAVEEQDRQDQLKMPLLELEGQQAAVVEEQYQQLHLQMGLLEEILCYKPLEGAVRQEQQMAQTVETDGLRFMMGKQQQEVEVVRDQALAREEREEQADSLAVVVEEAGLGLTTEGMEEQVARVLSY